jgi:signal transduction histidine kinase/ActR/RegA family two-component response regulator/HPt (histidine-containing phosphotransfer) domain-containing protein
MKPNAEQRLLHLVEKLQHENAQLRERAGTESHSRLMAEAALGQTEERLQLALDAAGLAMWEWDVSRDTVFTSARFADLLGLAVGAAAQDLVWSSEELLEKIAVDDRSRLHDALVALVKRVHPRLEVEFRIGSAAGALWLECTGEVTRWDMLGRAEQVVGILRDVTRRREIAQEMEAARAAAVAANAAKDEFLAHMSHEIRTPLNGVIGMNNLLTHTALTPEQRQYVDLVGSSGRALLVLVNDVLDYSRLQAQMLLLEQVRFDLRHWLWEVVTPQRIAAQAKGLELQWDVQESVPLQAVGDPGRLRQIVINLVSNAIKFTDQGSILVRLQATANHGAQQWLQLQVIDSGIGIRADKQESIFNAFVQADSSTSRRYGGSGLGLSICARLAQLMGGRISLDSTPGQGSCFTVQVPLGVAHPDTPVTQFGLGDLADVDQVVPNLLPSTLQPYAGQLALVVDDNSVNQLLASKLLQRLGFTVDVVFDGEQALQAVYSHPYELVLLDIQMPGMSGWQAAFHIRQWEQRERRSRVPIIALSAHASAADREQAVAAGMDGYLSKPLTPEALQSALRASGLGSQGGQGGNGVAGRSPGTGPLPAPQADAVDPDRGLAQGLVSRSRLLARLGGDEAALREMAQAFGDDLRERMRLAFMALKKQDWPATRAQAHALKGALLTMTAHNAASQAHTLEKAARANDSLAATAAFDSLSQAAKVAFDSIQNW